jgi:hypothetical protein
MSKGRRWAAFLWADDRSRVVAGWMLSGRDRTIGADTWPEDWCGVAGGGRVLEAIGTIQERRNRTGDRVAPGLSYETLGRSWLASRMR